MSATHQTQTYDLAQSSWRNSAPIEVCDESGQRLCTVPYDFLIGSGVEALTLLARITSMCVVEEGFLADQELRELKDIGQLAETGPIWVRNGKHLWFSLARAA